MADTDTLENVINDIIGKVNEWCLFNKLLLNTDKTYVYFVHATTTNALVSNILVSVLLKSQCEHTSQN